MNITKIQSMLLIATLIGSASVPVSAVRVADGAGAAGDPVSEPSGVSTWDYVVLFLVLGGAAIYLQSNLRQS
ncbi:MAG: hypothetical protein MZW92_09540 [Comamonadaceae bacterium]|nr:hypothetical protein [Comamonadaceae bacterium]